MTLPYFSGGRPMRRGQPRVYYRGRLHGFMLGAAACWIGWYLAGWL